MCNQHQLFTDFVKSPISLSGVSSTEISLSWGIVTFTLTLENGQIRVQIPMTYVLYIYQSPANLISLYKLNEARLYCDNRSWYLWDNKKKRQIIGYIPKWRKS